MIHYTIFGEKGNKLNDANIAAKVEEYELLKKRVSDAHLEADASAAAEGTNLQDMSDDRPVPEVSSSHYC